MARETQILRLTVDEVARLERLCTTPDPDVANDAVVFDRSVSFSSDCVGYVQVISSARPDKKPCWTQAVLFQQGVSDELLELVCTPPGDTVLGEYNMRIGNREYTIDVVLDRNEEFV